MLRCCALFMLTASAAAYSLGDALADHTNAAIEFAEAGNMDSAVASFRAATKFTPGPETWSNLAEALTDEDWSGAGSIFRWLNRVIAIAISTCVCADQSTCMC